MANFALNINVKFATMRRPRSIHRPSGFRNSSVVSPDRCTKREERPSRHTQWVVGAQNAPIYFPFLKRYQAETTLDLVSVEMEPGHENGGTEAPPFE
jgi:hypothetical protein